MKRILIFVGMLTWGLVLAGVCQAVDPKRPAAPPAAAPAPAPAPTPPASPGGSSRYSMPPNNGGTESNARAARVAAQAAAAQAAAAQAAATQAAAAKAAAIQAAQNAAAARNAANAAANTNTQANSSRTNSNAYQYNSYYSPYGYSPYGYYPYGYYSPYGYVPPGTTPYMFAYNPWTGAGTLVPYTGGYSPYNQNPYLGYGYPGAVFAPADQLYGLGPVQQLMGVAAWQQPQGNANFAANGNPNANGNGNANGNAGNANPGLANNNPAPGAAAVDPAAHKPPAAAGGKALEIAWKFITYGDAHFGNQKYNDALERYRSAARECPTLGEAWFREGFALAALGHYDQAAKAMRHGLEVKPDWADGNFRLSEIYGDDPTEKKATLNKMIEAAEAQPNDADLAFVLGIHLYCDGKPDQAAPFLRRAAQILGTDADVKPFLPKEQ